MDKEFSSYNFLKVITSISNVSYGIIEVTQVILLSIYINYGFGYYYNTTGILINCALCCVRILTCIIAMHICYNVNTEDIQRNIKRLYFLIFGTMVAIIGGFAFYIIMHSYVTLQKNNDGTSVTVVLIILGLDTIWYILAWLCAYKLSLKILKFHFAGLLIPQDINNN